MQSDCTVISTIEWQFKLSKTINLITNLPKRNLRILQELCFKKCRGHVEFARSS